MSFPQESLKEQALQYATYRIYTPDTLRIMRLYLGLSQNTISQRLGVTVPTFSRWETHGDQGRQVPLAAASIVSLLVIERSTGSTNLMTYLQSPASAFIPEAPKEEPECPPQ